MPAASPSLRWLYLAVLGPLVLLAGLAWWGTQSQLKAAWTEARTEAEQLAPQLSSDLASEIQSSLRSIPNYPDPPQPGPPSPKEEILASEDLDALAALRDDSNAGASASGLPLRALAALRIETLSPGTQPRPNLLQLLTREAPSTITAPALDHLDLSSQQWLSDELIRSKVRPLPVRRFGVLSMSGVSFHRDQIDAFALGKRTGGNIEYFAGDWGYELLESARRSMKSGLFATFNSSELRWETRDRESSLLASASLRPELPLTLEIRAIPDILEAPIRRQQRWTLAILTAALLTAVIALVVIHRTVSRERRLAELKSQFVASVSHELRAPLGSIRLMAESLQQERVSKPAEFHTLIAREGARLSHLIENVLDFARIEEGRKHYHFEECDLSALLRDTLRLMQPLAEDHHVHLAFDIPELTATVDPNALQQALVNLIDNAIKFSPEGSAVTVAAESIRQSDRESIRISITDQGPGIPKAEHRNIFNRFHRLGNELRRETQGTGIGLSIVKHVAEAHHGSISVDSTPPEGSTFTLTFPQ